jgi:hypothetical protein
VAEWSVYDWQRVEVDPTAAIARLRSSDNLYWLACAQAQEGLVGTVVYGSSGATRPPRG